MRIALLQQTAESDTETAPAGTHPSNKTVIEQVVEGDPYRNRLLHEFKSL